MTDVNRLIAHESADAVGNEAIFRPIPASDDITGANRSQAHGLQPMGFREK
jgi:hypothetical protein